MASEECAAAVALYYRLRWQRWAPHPETGEPVELTPEQVGIIERADKEGRQEDKSAERPGMVEVGGETLAIYAKDVVTGSIGVTTRSTSETLRRMGRDLGMYPLWSGDMTEFETLGIQPEDMGMMPFPGLTEAHRPVLQASNSFFMIGKDVLTRGGDTEAERKIYRDYVWEIMTRICSVEGNDENIRRKVAAGQAKFLNPRELKRLGFDDYLRESPPEYLELWNRIDRGDILEVVEPFMGKWLQFRDFYQREVISIVLSSEGEGFDYLAALEQLERDANTGIMFERPPEELAKHRPLARVVAIVVIGILSLFLILIIRDQMRKVQSRAGVYKGILPWAMLLPAVATIAVWSYYPLFRGLVMAFQDYKIVGKSPFVGLTNFISIMLDPNFYHYLWATFRYVLWNLLLAFFTPILLAILLTEVPRLKVFFRTLFFLPQMTSGLVVTLLWKEMYMESAQGTLNRLVSWLFGLVGMEFSPVGLADEPAHRDGLRDPPRSLGRRRHRQPDLPCRPQERPRGAVRGGQHGRGRDAPQALEHHPAHHRAPHHDQLRRGLHRHLPDHGQHLSADLRRSRQGDHGHGHGHLAGGLRQSPLQPRHQLCLDPRQHPHRLHLPPTPYPAACRLPPGQGGRLTCPSSPKPTASPPRAAWSWP